MKRFLCSLGVVAIAVSIVPVVAQSKPSFAGKWTPAADPDSAGRGRGRLGQDFTVTQSDKTLTTATDDPQRADLNATYQLDGSESRNPVTVNGQTIQLISKARWEGSKLVIVTTTNFGGGPSESIQTWSLDASGNLIIEMTSTIGARANTTTAKYKRAALRPGSLPPPVRRK